METESVEIALPPRYHSGCCRVGATAAYLLLCLFSRFVRNPNIRFRLHGVFLSGAVATWLYLLLSPGLRVLPEATGTAGAIISAKHFSLSLNPVLLPGFAKGLSLASWGYAIILALLLARFCGHHWRLRNFLRGSQPPPDALSLLFELVRSGNGSPHCELRLVEDLRSPATTGWWHPKILLSRELLLRLRMQQLVHIFQHELMHVRRRDYLWDRLSTLGCDLIFFHPAAWLARHRLRWEREFVCDEGVAQRSQEGRLEYASCLTTLANWWFLGEERRGQVDFLSSPSSLLAARVRALLAQPPLYDSCKKAVFTALATLTLAFAVMLAPQVVVSSYPVTQVDLLRNQPLLGHQGMITPIGRQHHTKRQKHAPSVPPAVAPNSSSPLSNLNLNLPVKLPILSSPPTHLGYVSESSASGVPIQPTFSSGSSEDVQSSGKVWDESLPQPPRTRASKVKSIGLRILKLGIGVAASQIGDHEHEREH